MELLDQKAKKIMEECKIRARAAGLKIEGETLEYIVTNQDLLELSPKVMIPTLYDYWIDDIEIVSGKWVYGAYPSNPYETVINTRPAISFYNDNNPDWLNTMIFYHVLGHIDFFQNNVFFRNTWDIDFCNEALAGKRLINRIREELGAEKRWVDYIIEFARGIDNLVGYYQELSEGDVADLGNIFNPYSEKINFYFSRFLTEQKEKGFTTVKFYYDELERFNSCHNQFGDTGGESAFFNDPIFKSKFPEFERSFKDKDKNKKRKSRDLLQHLIDNSEFIDKPQNSWMKEVLGIVRKTSLYFQPQIRTKNANEGWASLWHERLFESDPRSRTHEVDFATTNSGVVVDPRIGLNPYIGFKRLFEYIEELAKRGKISREYQLLQDIEARDVFDKNLGEGIGYQALFEARRSMNDSTFVNFLSDDDFQDFVDRYRLFVAGRRINIDRGVVEYFVKSRNGKDYRKMLNDSLYHPPHIEIIEDYDDTELYLYHVFEGRALVASYIPAVLRGLYFLARKPVKLETTEFSVNDQEMLMTEVDPDYKPEYEKVRVIYECEGAGVKRIEIGADDDVKGGD